MTVWELFGVTLSSAGLFASILGAFLTYAARKYGEATRDLIRAMEQQMGDLIARMDQRAEERHREALHLFDRMDQRTEQMDRRADERHREAIQAIGTLRAT